MPLLITRPQHYCALFLMAMSVILWEVLLTRIYSVLLYYHFAFMAVSTAMFGLSLGAVLVIMHKKENSTPERPVDEGLGYLALITGLLMAVAITVQLSVIPPLMHGSIELIGLLIRTYILSALPLVPAGSFICILLTRSTKVNKLYAADLIGAGLGCALVAWLLPLVGGPGATIATAALACLAAVCLLFGKGRGFQVALIATIGLFLFAAVNEHSQLLRVRWRHNGIVSLPLYENWNAFSRVMVQPGGSDNHGWGIEPFWQQRVAPVPHLNFEIDSGAGTPIMSFNGQLDAVRLLRYDITSFVHYLRPNASVLIIGSGGGRDVLSALAFHQAAIQAVDVNPSITGALNGLFGDYSGHLDRRPDVHFVVAEGRHFIQSTAERFDIIQVSLVDTVAATAAGAYSFVESGLYTVEGWRFFLSHLSPRGVLSFSRWYYGSTTWPVEVARTVSLAAETLRSEGLVPREHIIVIRNSELRPPREGIATILTSRDNFSVGDLARVRETCRELKCEIALADGKGDPLLSAIVNTSNPNLLYRQLPLDISPPTDNKPYFFFHARFRDILRRRESRQFGGSSFNLPAVRILLELLAMTFGLSLLLIIWPYLRLKRQHTWADQPVSVSIGMPLYFGLIGAAFMFLEIAWMQRFSLFLGHPTYGFTVILFGLLAATGAGSWALSAAKETILSHFRLTAFILIPFLLLSDLIGVPLLDYSAAAPLAVRMLLTLGLIGGPAFMMGLYFPMGMVWVQEQANDRSEWLWTINGALSVSGSVLAMVTSLAFGIRATLWTGGALYLIAACLLEASNQDRIRTKGLFLAEKI